ncbi:branched-chain amino acid ABC transporter permease [Anaerocolumna sedimenticola]|uniref:Branched-chain amino acid ABC transporter permease n=1 Tax=Anaerocolumna sedimenticola TaxID=2696063 RepID=A0A6P1TPL3_9FIRM|nr:AzlC family ABC transporter permease [Anaerocolumna sedimenticola]QHQ61831.1 branched-chain amino acid ABC transporter permease [Anaerocolumna sedimenticola]
MNTKIKALRAAFPLTIPVFTGYIILGTAYGILLNSKGYSYLWAALTSIFIYAGSMQFVSVSLLAAGFHPLYACFMTLMVNARHLFYGISMLSKFQGIGKKKPYLILGLTDETFSILCSTQPPDGVDKGWFLFFITLLNQIYWVSGSILGSILGSFLHFNTKGIDFVLTALFVVIFINQWKSAPNHMPVLIGLSASVICRILFGSANFIIPSMIVILLSVTIFQNKIESRNK